MLEKELKKRKKDKEKPLKPKFQSKPMKKPTGDDFYEVGENEEEEKNEKSEVVEEYD